MFFIPEFQGQLELESVPDDFVERLEQRIERGLLVPGNRSRANYRVQWSGRDAITFTAEGFVTIYNVGLNQVTVRRAGANRLDYQVSFWGWTGYAVAHGAILGLLFAATYLLVPEVGREIGAYGHGAAWCWTLIGFFSLAWPWLLTGIHRAAARQLLERILRETLTDSGDSGAGVAKSA